MNAHDTQSAPGSLRGNRPGSGLDRPPWLAAIRRYLLFIAVANLLWEFAQLPLYTIWNEGTPGEIAFATLHCSGADVLIAAASLLGALIVTGSSGWPHEGYRRVGTVALVMGVSITIFGEWLNTEVRRSWAYTEFMPTLPWIGTGLSPVAQWIVIPIAALWWTRRAVLGPVQREERA